MEWTVVVIPNHKTGEQFELGVAGNMAQQVLAALEAAEQAEEQK